MLSDWIIFLQYGDYGVKFHAYGFCSILSKVDEFDINQQYGMCRMGFKSILGVMGVNYSLFRV